jgi:diguanylate cyclase (GGDEF)-like protein/PAS domain S-box-containing protein
MRSGAKKTRRISPRQLRLAVLTLLIGVNLFVAALSVYSLFQSRQQYEQRARIVAENTVAAIDRSLTGSIDKIDLALRAVADELERQLAVQRNLEPKAVGNTLQRYQQRIPEIEAIRIADASGLVIFGKGLDPKAGVSWNDRDYFQELRSHADGRLVVSKPRMGKVAKTPIIGFARRYNYPDGRFAGVVSAPVAIDYFTGLLSHFVVGEHGTAVLRDTDLGLVTRYPPAPDSPAGKLGNTTVSHELKQLVDAGAVSATYHTELAADQLARTSAYRRIAKAPMLVIAGLASDDYLAGWRIEQRETWLRQAGFFLLSVLAALLLLRLINRIFQENLRNQLFLRHSSDGIHILDEAGDIVQVSDSFCAMLGYRQEEMMGMNVSHWDARWPSEQLLNEVLPQKLGESQASNIESVHRRKDGSLIHVELNLVGFAVDGRRYLFASARDIGDRLRQQQALRDSEARLRQSEERYRQLLNHLPVGVLHVNADLLVTYGNPRFEEIMGLPQGYAPHIDCKTLQDQSVLPAIRLALAGSTGHYEGPYVTTYGRLGMMLTLNAAPVFDDQGAIQGAIVIVEDTTERKQAEARLRLAASVFAHAHEGIMICDAEQTILEVNPTFSEITGYSRTEAIGKTPHLLNSGRHDQEFFRHVWQHIAAHGFWEGELWNKNKNGHTYAERLTISSVIDDSGKLTHYIGTFSDISMLKEQQAQLEHLAHYDPLTHLPNRALLADRMNQALAQAKRAGSEMAVCYLDLDGFKEINDRHGHNIGDLLLIEVADRLCDTLRAGDTVARLGGDEFVLLFVGIDGIDECQHAVGRVLKALAAPASLQGIECRISASIGISRYPEDDSAPDTLLRHADQAMYLAKQAGKNRMQFYDATQDSLLRSQRDEAEQLRRALAQGELELHYQPIVNMRKGCVLGVEGLLRWRHPQRGLLLPADFLPASEGSSVENEIGRWVLATGLQQLAAWQGQGLSLQLNLNIASGHLLAPDFIEHLRELLASHPELAAGSLELEVIEAATMNNAKQAGDVLERCRELGIGIAIDDFGTGYSSLAHFRRLPADTLKIDQAFVLSVLGSMEDLAIVDSVIKLTQAFNRKLIAEGVESVEIGMLLLHLGCQVGQGFGIARPMPAAEIPAWIASFKPDPNWSSPAIQFTREDIPLLLAELEHRRWIKQIEGWLLENGESPSPPPLSSEACRFGRWYNGPGVQHYGRYPAFQALNEQHQAVHQLGQALVALHQAGQNEAARQRLGELHALRDQLVTQIAVLQATLIAEQQH